MFSGGLSLLSGCQTTGGDDLVYFHHPASVQYVETEDIQWTYASEGDQELADEI